MKTNRTLLAVALALLTLHPAGALADSSLSVRSSNRFVADPSYDLLSGDDLLPQIEFNAAGRVLSVWPGHLWVEGSYLLGWRKSAIFGGRSTAWSYTHTFLAGARFSAPVLSWLAPMVRISLGVVVGGLGLETKHAAGQDAEAWTAAFCGQALAGLEIKIPPVSIFRRATVGLTIEGGYTYATPLNFSLEPGSDDDLRLISQSGIDLGSLDLSGPMVVAGAVIQF